MNSIFISGHSGLLGSAIHRHLLKNNFKNIITKSSRELNLMNSDATSSFIRENKPDCVIIGAGKTGGIQENKNSPYDLINQNLLIQANLLNASKNNNVKKILFFGSSCMYPKNSSIPMTEDTLLTGEMENSSLPYAIAKIAGIQTCLALNKQFKINAFIPLIPNSVYGPNDNFDSEKGHVLASLIHKFHHAKILNKNAITLWGTGKPIREFVFSDDLADACMFVLNSDVKVINKPINISSGEECSIMELASIIKNIVGFKGRIKWNINKPDGTARKSLDIRQITALGWKPQTSLENGVKLTYKWYLEHICVNQN